MRNSTEVKDHEFDNSTNATAVPFYGDYTIYFKRNTSSAPMVEFKVGEQYECFTGAFAMYPYRSLSPVDYSWKSYSCARDPRYTRLTQIGEYDLYTINGAWQKMRYIPNYPASNSYQWGLDQRPYIPWKQACYSDFESIFNKMLQCF